MNFKLSKIKSHSFDAEAIAVCTKTNQIKRSTLLDTLNKKSGNLIAKTLSAEQFEGKAGESKVIRTYGFLACNVVFVFGAHLEKKGDLAPNELETIRCAAAKAAKRANALKIASLAFDIGQWPSGSFQEADKIQAAVEGMILGSYRFTVYQKDKAAITPSLQEVTLLVSKNSSSERRALEFGQAVAHGTSLARDLVNTPAKDMTPVEMAKRAKNLGKGISVRIYSKSEIEKMKMGSFLAVAQGSEAPPALLHMTYQPKKKSRAVIAIVGKGVTFDSGGLSLKPPASMETMKDDMSGAATVIGLMDALKTLQPNVTVHGVVAATENMPSGSAIKPGDVATAMNGKTIEILNTDAEGRLTLADALHFVIQKKPDLVIDLATLTGACLVALGERCAGVMSNDAKLLKKIRKSATKCAEMVWPLPLIEEYREDLKSPIADLKNIGGRWAGTIEAGLFLQEFVGDTSWAHLDIAGPSWASKDLPYGPKGGTGVMVRTLADFLMTY
jgi:leucyl aminopeptidase